MAADLELQDLLGRGSLAEVWKAFDPQLQRSVAVKVFHADLLNDPDFMTSFQNLLREREAKLIISLRHPNIVRMHGFQISPPDEAGKTLAYIVMDYIEGPTLADYLRNTSYRRDFPSATEVKGLFASIAAAIDYAHQQGVIHGDLKPTNILLDKHHTERNPMGEPMLTDFGITSLLATSAGALRHKELDIPFYTSPEQAQGNPATEHSDIYALGVILYEICAGARPFQRDNPAIVREQHINSRPPAPKQVNPNISPALSAVIMHSLAKDPEKRFPSAASMVTALSEALDISDLETLSLPVTKTNTTKGQAESTFLPDVVPPRVSLSPHVAAQSSPQSSTSVNTGQGVPVTPPDTSGEGRRPAES